MVVESIRILYVDDDRRAREAADALEGADERFRVETAAGASEGVERLAEGSVDCIVSAHGAGTDGVEFLATVREERPDLPFVLFPEEGSEEVAAEAIERGASGYVPSDGDDRYADLAERVRRAVGADRQGLPGENGRFRKLIESSTDAIVVIDESGAFEYLSPSVERLLGYEPEELVGEDAFEFMHPDDREEVRDEFLTIVEDASHTATEEFRYRDADGAWRWLEAHGKNLLDDPAVGGVVVNVRDVTERKERQQELEEARQFTAEVIENAPVGLVRLDEDLRITYENPEAREIFGAPGDEPEPPVVGEDIREVPSVVDAGMAEEFDRLPDGDTVEFEEPFESIYGKEAYLSGRAVPLYRDGEFSGGVVMVDDVTERRERERELEQYETIVETVPEGVFVLDEEGTIVGGNETAAGMLGYEADDLVGEPFQWLVEEGVVGEDVIDTYLDHVGSMLSSETEREQAQFEYAVTVDGEERVYETHLALRPYEEEFRGTIGVVRDVTDEKRQRRELERQNERLEEFASVVSHDLRNPLNVARGRVDLAREERDGEHLDVARDALERMETLIEELLTLAREGETVEETETVDLAGVAENCWRTVDTDEATLVADADCTVDADRSRLQQLLENLFRNAVDHGGDEVTITVDDLDDLDGVDDREGFYVADDGPGIPEKKRDRVFESGYSTAEEGTGFGLSIVREIVEAHGWDVDVRESAAGGARFEVVTDDTA